MRNRGSRTAALGEHKRRYAAGGHSDVYLYRLPPSSAAKSCSRPQSDWHYLVPFATSAVWARIMLLRLDLAGRTRSAAATVSPTVVDDCLAIW